MAQTTPGPIAQLRSIIRHPGAGLLGALLGGFVPVTGYITAHYGHMLVYRGDDLHLAHWANPRWVVVLGCLGFSAKSVYQWALAAFCDAFKAGGFVALVEGALLLAPLPELAYVALAYLVAINMLSAGSALALRDQSERIEVAEVHFEVSAPAPELPLPAPALMPTESRPSPSLAASGQCTGPGLDDYARALAYLETVSECSARTLRAALGIGSDRASELVTRLAKDGALGEPNGKGRRPVQLASTSAAE